MRLSPTLLVAIMYTTIIGMSIGALLSSLAAVIDRGTDVRRDGIFLSWAVLLLLLHFGMFWHTVEITLVDDWRFGGFLRIVAGPILLLFATNLLVSGAAEAEDRGRYYYEVCTRFFVMFAALQMWVVSVDFGLGHGVTDATMTTLALLVLALGLSISREPRIHVPGAMLGWLVLVGSWIWRAGGGG